MSIENTPGFDGISAGQFVEAMERHGQQQLVASDLLPAEIAVGNEEDLTAMGITLGAVVHDNPLLRKATLPTGWTRSPSKDTRRSTVSDEHGRVRLSCFYKSGLYERSAYLAVLSPQDYVRQAVAAGQQVITDDEWCTPGAVADAAAALIAETRDSMGYYHSPARAARLREEAAAYETLARRYANEPTEQHD